MCTVLTVSCDTDLLLQRNAILSIYGFRVVSPRIPEEAPSLAVQQRVDAVVIGHSLESDRRAILIRTMRRIFPNCVILFVYFSPEAHGEVLADISLDVTDGPQPLINALETIKALQNRLPVCA